ncbi:MAG: MFS transporter, partial [Chloroflexi bacterium]
MASVVFVAQFLGLRIRNAKLLLDQRIGKAFFPQLKGTSLNAAGRLFHASISIVACVLRAAEYDRLDDLSAAEPGPASTARPQPTITNQIPADRRYWVLGTVMLVQFTAVMTSTIVSTATPTIVDELHGLNLYAWLFSSYLLASSVTVPVVGKLSDLFGRRPFYIGGLLLFLIGSAFSGLSQNMGELIAARAVTGIGGGAMMAL